MITRIQLPQPVRPLHLYRHLLREASYLPQICRPIADHAIRARFEAAGDAIERLKRKQPFKKDATATTPEARLKKVSDDGIRQLRALRAVNLGDRKRLTRFLKHVFARLGRRRREQVSQFLHSPAPANSADLQSRLDNMNKQDADTPRLDEHGRPMKPVTHDKWDIPRLQAYLKSQLRQQSVAQPSAFEGGQTVSGFEPSKYVNEFSTTDVWDKPMPERRVRLKIQYFWKYTIRRLAPPISKFEWEKLGAAAAGQLSDEMSMFRPRRTIALPTPGAEQEESPTWDWKSNASRPAYAVEYPFSWRQWRLTAQTDEGPYAHGRGGRTLFSRRNLRREYRNIFQTTSYIEDGPKPTVHWGPNAERPIREASPAQSRVFQNVDAETQAIVDKSRLRKRRGSR